MRVPLMFVAMCMLLVGCKTDEGRHPKPVHPTQDAPKLISDAKHQETLSFLQRQAELSKTAVNKLVIGRTGSLLVVYKELGVDDSILLVATPDGSQFASNSLSW